MIYLFMVPFIALLALSIFDRFIEKHKIDKLSSDIFSDSSFTKWAFGSAYEEYLMGKQKFSGLMQAWNTLHGDIYLAHPTNIIHEDIKKMYELYKKNGEK